MVRQLATMIHLGLPATESIAGEIKINLLLAARREDQFIAESVYTS